jgi:hypothetical protein
VSGFGKTIAAVVLLVMNIFFAYYSVLFGFTKGIAWQRTYLSACIVQLIVEVLINETLEVVWMNFFVPTLVAEEVQAVSTSVLDIVRNLCSSLVTFRTGFNATEPLSRSVFNAADYLFVPYNVAKCYPTHMESFLVQTFTSHLPGELSKKWHIGSMKRLSAYTSRHGGNGNFSLLRFNVVFSIAYVWLKYCATAPSILQRMFIRSAQPFLVTGIIMAFSIVMESPVFIAVFVVGVVIVFAYFIYRYYRGLEDSLLERNLVHPLDPSYYDEKEGIVEIADESYNSDTTSVDCAILAEESPIREDESNVSLLINSSRASQGGLSDDISTMSSSRHVVDDVDMEEDDYCISELYSEDLSSKNEDVVHSSSSSSIIDVSTFT